MYETNVPIVLSQIRDTDLVLDIGGWARPFNRADYVMDAEPYETRGLYGTPQGGERERFTADTWIRRDICERTPYPFEDKSVDFVTCSHTLEDVRDPLWVCSEMIRIGKRGYLEVPSRVAESCRGTEPGQVGWSHHRWLIEIEGDRVQFLMKYHMIHSHWRFSFPARFLRSLPEARRVRWLFWSDRFDYGETTIHTAENIAVELERFVAHIRPYPGWTLAVDRAWRRVVSAERRVAGKVRRILGAGG